MVQLKNSTKRAQPLSALLFVCVMLLTLAPVYAQTDNARVETLLANMTLEQKIGQMFMVTLHGEIMTEAGAAFLRTYQPGAVSLFGENVTSPAGVTQLTNNFQQTMLDAGSVPLLIAIDQEGGLVARLNEANGFTQFPAPILLTAAGEAMAQQVGIAVAEELAAVGINMNLAPVADLETNPENPIIFRRSFGNDPELAGAAVAAFARGSQFMNVLATAKHFPGHGETREDSHGELPRLDLSSDRVRAVELAPFRAAIASDVAAVMVGHLWYPALDPTPNMPASLSHAVITDVLRGELGYDGLIMTDALDMNAVDMTYNFYEALVMSVNAGADMLAMGPSTGLEVVEAAIQYMITAVAEGRIDPARIEDAARHVLEAKARYGILDWQPLDPITAVERVNVEAHAALIEDLYRAGVTVAYDDHNLVPVDTSRRVAILFLGTRYQIYDECGLYTNPDLTRWLAISDAPSADEIASARELGNWADTVIVWTQNAISTVEQGALVNALPPDKTVAVAIFSPYDWTTYPNVGAYVATYSPARPAVPAACAALFGTIPANGQLAVTMTAGERTVLAGSRDE